jgi:hypothetical protein
MKTTRRSITDNSTRLKDYDYSQPGVYFITLVTQGHTNLFGEISDGVMQINHLGEITQPFGNS